MGIDDIIELQALSDANRMRVQILAEAFDAMAELAHHGNKMALYDAMAEKLSGQMPQISRKNGKISRQTIIRLYSEYKERGWRALAVNYARKTDYVTLPQAFIHHWKTLYVRHQTDRSGAQAHAALLAQLAAWRAGDRESVIPGYAEPPADQPTKGWPKGWGLRNLMRHKPDKAVVTLIKKGRAAAKAKHGPLVRHTRSNLEPGEIIIFDDVWQDHEVAHPASKTLVRPLGLVALDLASGKQIAWGMKPRLKDEAEGKSVGLKGCEMEELLTQVLCQFGVHPNGTTLYMEHGTATVSERVEKMLFDRFRIRVERGGVDRLPSWEGGLVGNFKGNSRFKAWLESHHNLMHNAMSCLPGYTGKNRDLPEHTQGMKLAHAALIRRAERMQLPPEVIERLGVGALPWHMFMDAYAACLDWVNARTEHELEGWERRLVTEVRMSPQMPWMALDPRLPKEARDALCAMPELHRVRKMSPTEVWAHGAGKLNRIKFSALGELFFDPGKQDARRTVSVSDRHEFIVTPRYDDPTEYIFSAEIELPNGGVRMLECGERFKVLINPLMGDELCVYSMDGGYLGSTFARKERIPLGVRELELPAVGAAAREFSRIAHPADALARARRDEIQDAERINRIAIAEHEARKREAQAISEAKKIEALERPLAITQTLITPDGPEIGDDDDDFSTPSF
ncbi:MAG: hypothetical protein Q4C03_01865 [bacterium]|nr:hypothetical protein [bacterium]